MKILSKSIANLLSKFASHSSNSFRKIPIHAPTAVKQHNKLKLLVFHGSDRSPYTFSLLPEDNDNNNYNYNNNRYRTFPAHGLGHYPYFYPSASCKSLLFGSMDGRRALWNPTTDEVKTLPVSSVPRPPSVKHEYSLVYGFGFDPSSQDYKVLRFLEFDYVDGTESLMGEDQVELYSLKTDSWKGIKFPHKYVHRPLDGPYAIHVNGFYYWVVSFGRVFGQVCPILRFEFASESFSSAHIPMPATDKLRDEPRNFFLAEFEGSLAVVVYALGVELGTDAKPFEFEIWVWSNDEGSWTRVFAIDVPAAAVEKPLGFFKNYHLYFKDLMGELMLFDCAKGNLKNLGLKGDQLGSMTMFPYVESSKRIGAILSGDKRVSGDCRTCSRLTAFFSHLCAVHCYKYIVS